MPLFCYIFYIIVVHAVKLILIWNKDFSISFKFYLYAEFYNIYQYQRYSPPYSESYSPIKLLGMIESFLKSQVL